MSAVIKYAHEFFQKEVFSIAYDKTLSPQQRMEKMFKNQKELYCQMVTSWEI